MKDLKAIVFEMCGNAYDEWFEMKTDFDTEDFFERELKKEKLLAKGEALMDAISAAGLEEEYMAYRDGR